MKNLTVFWAVLSSLLISSESWAGSPASPVCGHSGATFFYSGPVLSIPEDPDAPVSAQITVAGLPPFLWDVDVTTFIKHPYAADLDVTVTSPQGTVVTLTTDNGSGAQDAFFGTLWDDQADPGGQVPYTSPTSRNMVTDALYDSGSPMPVLAPEEPLSAFYGENPNGIWTLTLHDDLAGSAGSLSTWALNIVSMKSMPDTIPFTLSNPAVVAISSGAPSVVSSSINVSDADFIEVCGIEVNTRTPHTFAADLDITLQSPLGRVVTLTSDNGGGNDHVFADTLWKNRVNVAGSLPYTSQSGAVTDHSYTNLLNNLELSPEESLGAFSGEIANGIWTLTVSDDAAADGGNLNGWSLTVHRCVETDLDGDAVPDSCDQCPLDAAKIYSGFCGCGAPETDNNLNGIIDCRFTEEFKARVTQAMTLLGQMKVVRGKLTAGGKTAKQGLLGLLQEMNVYVAANGSGISVLAGKNLNRLHSTAQKRTKKATRSLSRSDKSAAAKALNQLKAALS